MAQSLNRAEVIGNLGRDPDVRTFQDGGRVATISVATAERYKNRSTGDYDERTEWHRIVSYHPFFVDLLTKHGKKGRRVFISGRLQTRKWTGNDGADHYATEIVIPPSGQLLFLDRPDQTAPQGADPAAAPPPANPPADEVINDEGLQG